MLKIIKRTGEFFHLSQTTRWALIFYLFGLLSFGAYKQFKHPSLEKLVIGSDMEGYYQYLPCFFLHDWHDFEHLPWAKTYGEGKTLAVFTCGTAILQSPFFLTAHGITELSGLKADGYGPIYYFFVMLAGLFYATLGLLFLFKALCRDFSEKTAFLTSVLTFYGTNLFYYTIMGPGMSHVYSFFLISVFLYSVPLFYERPGIKTTFQTALPFALAVLIRPTNAVAIVYFVLYGIASSHDLFQRFNLFFRKLYLLILMLLMVFCVYIPQFVYWHYVTGQWLVYSYQDEGFTHWKNPQILTVLFGKRGGWFVYTPLMLAASVSLVRMLKKRLPGAPAILITMMIIIYLDASWWAPTFSASAGYRALIEFLPFMAVPLAFGFQEMELYKSKKLKNFMTVILLIFVVYNVQFAFKYDATVWWDWVWSYKTMLRLITF